LCCWSDQLKDDEMAGTVTAVDGVMAQCASSQEQERMRNYLEQISRSTAKTSNAVFGIKMQNDVTLFCMASWFIRSDCIGMVNRSVPAHHSPYSQLVRR
jgi:hypothetical protein